MQGTCSYADCEGSVTARGWCWRHYMRWRRYGSPDPVDKVARFWSRVDIGEPDDCWPWTLRRDDLGYGQVGIKGVANGAHRIAYALTHGSIPEGAMVCHHCDNPPCCNPAHLYAGDHATNSEDMMRRGRHGFKRLTRDEILQIHEMAKLGESRAAIGRKFNTSGQYVGQILAGKARTRW